MMSYFAPRMILDLALGQASLLDQGLRGTA